MQVNNPFCLLLINMKKLQQSNSFTNKQCRPSNVHAFAMKFTPGAGESRNHTSALIFQAFCPMATLLVK